MAKKVSLEDEFRRNNELKPEHFQIFKDWYAEQSDLPAISDELLILFLHSCFFKLDSAKTVVRNYFTIRTNVPEVFSNRDPFTTDLVNGKKIMQFFTLNQTTTENYRVFCIKFGITEPSVLNFAEMCKSLIMHTDYELYMNGSFPGWYILMDMEGIQFGHLRKCNLYITRKMFHYLEEAIPIRLKGWHIINVSRIAKILFEMMKPFMKKEIAELIHFHTNGMESLYEVIPKNILPSDYGGEELSIAELASNELNQLQQNKQLYETDLKLLPENL